MALIFFSNLYPITAMEKIKENSEQMLIDFKQIRPYNLNTPPEIASPARRPPLGGSAL